MPWLVNEQVVPEALIQQEARRLARDPRWNQISDPAERAQGLRQAAAECAQNVVLIEQRAAADPRPVEEAEIDAEIARRLAEAGCRTGFSREHLRPLAEHNIRLDRIKKELVAGAVLPTVEQMEAFFNANREHFPRPEMFHASHIVRYVNPAQTAEMAEAALILAEEELDRGCDFAEVADRWSDCKDKGGDIGEFPAGVMVQEFEDLIRELEPGERSGIFTTPLGFHIALLHSNKPAGLADFHEARPLIERNMTDMANGEAYWRSIREMRATADIRWVPDAQAAAS
jgi:parvulin-like peptidyl-prolyl isomerase